MRALVQEYYAAQSTFTKLRYEKRQLERKRDQLLSRWRMHDSATCPQTLSSNVSTSNEGSWSAVETTIVAVETAGQPTTVLLPPSPPLGVASRWAAEDPAAEFDASDEDDIFDESLMDDLTDAMYDPLCRSFSCPADTVDVGFEEDPDVPSFAGLGELVPMSSAEEAADKRALQFRRPETSFAGASSRTRTRSRSFPLSYSTIDAGSRSSCTVGDLTAASSTILTPATAQSTVSYIPLHVRSLLESESEN